MIRGSRNRFGREKRIVKGGSYAGAGGCESNGRCKAIEAMVMDVPVPANAMPPDDGGSGGDRQSWGKWRG